MHGANYRMVKSVAICQPAVRMVVIHGWLDEDGRERHAFHPVVAIETQLFAEYHRDGWQQDLDIPRTHEEMLTAGWQYVGAPEAAA